MRRLAGGAALVLLLLLAITARPTAADFFSPISPLLAPVMGSLCKAVACGKGNCTVTPGLPGYRCDCEPGWTQMHVGDSLRFLPCVIPNCTIDRSCSNDTSAPSPAPSPKNVSISANPCDLAYCGSGGTCKNATGLNYHCECKEGFKNVLNMTTMPCFQDCKIIWTQATSLQYSKTTHLSSNSGHHFRFLRSGLRSHRDPTIHKLHFCSTTSWLLKCFKQLQCTCSRICFAANSTSSADIGLTGYGSGDINRGWFIPRYSTRESICSWTG